MEYLDVNDLFAVISYDVNPFQTAFFHREVLPALVAAKAAGDGNMSFETMGFYVFFPTSCRPRWGEFLCVFSNCWMAAKRLVSIRNGRKLSAAAKHSFG
jgi:hypothetical protein